MSRRFEFTDATSNKFWEITVKGKTVTVQYGRIGTEGQTQVKSHATPTEAKAAADKQVAEKVKKGYQEVGGASGAVPKASAVAAEKAPAKKSPARKASAKKAPAKQAASKPATPSASVSSKAGAGGGIAGKTFLFTGTLTTMTRAEAERAVKARGGTVLSGVTDQLDYLVVGEKAGSKLAKAKRIPRITVLTEADLQGVLTGDPTSVEEARPHGHEVEPRPGMHHVVLLPGFKSALSRRMQGILRKNEELAALDGNVLYLSCDLDADNELVWEIEQTLRKLAPYYAADFELYYFSYGGEYTATMFARKRGVLHYASGWIGDFCKARRDEARDEFVDRNTWPLKSGEILPDLQAALRKALQPDGE